MNQELEINPLKKKLKIWIHKHKKIYFLYKFPKFRYLTSPLRSLPDFIIIGAQKSGTTSLYDLISKHPGVIPTRHKELHYFSSTKYEWGTRWYRLNFPTKLEKRILEKKLNYRIITGEATPNYILHPNTKKRIKNLIPKTKIIVILRNPADRAYSHYNHNVERKLENLSFEEAIREKRFEGKEDKIYDDRFFEASNYMMYSYLLRGRYAEQLEAWFKIFEKDQILVVDFEEFIKIPNKVLNEIFEFLELPRYEQKNISKLNIGEYHSMDPQTRKFLIEYYKPDKEKLYKLLNRKFDWDK